MYLGCALKGQQVSPRNAERCCGGLHVEQYESSLPAFLMGAALGYFMEAQRGRVHPKAFKPQH